MSMDTYKWKAACPTCVERDTSNEDIMCANCGFPPSWPGVKPNNYVPDPEKIAAKKAAPPAHKADDMIIGPPDEEGWRSVEFKEEAEVVKEEGWDLPWEDLVGEPSELEPVDEVDETILEVEPETVPLEEQLPEDGRVPQVHIDEDNFYHCKKCDSRHKYDSSVGKKHLEYRE